ncbi:hypothetical protein [Cupriavidus lacunae]|uniref:hypothetical protein n=2 Tax=Burkholderiaceae TaxID=119060 RepID=UPI0013751CE6|nr:hypothetical protein [Cupriavidus lacunae]
MSAEFSGSHLDCTRSRSDANRRALLELAWSDTDSALFHGLAEASLREQARLEASDDVPFEFFRQHYLSPLQLHPQCLSCRSAVLHRARLSRHGQRHGPTG